MVPSGAAIVLPLRSAIVVMEEFFGTTMAPAAAAIAQPGYTEVVQAPPPVAYPGPLYDYVPAGAAPPAAVLEQPPLTATSINPTAFW